MSNENKENSIDQHNKIAKIEHICNMINNGDILHSIVTQIAENKDMFEYLETITFKTYNETIKKKLNINSNRCIAPLPPSQLLCIPKNKCNINNNNNDNKK